MRFTRTYLAMMTIVFLMSSYSANAYAINFAKSYENNDNNSLLGFSTLVESKPRFASPTGIGIGIKVNEPPVAEAGKNQEVEATSRNGTSVTLDASASYDPNNDPLTYTWLGKFGVASGKIVTVVIPLGVDNVILEVYDGLTTSSDKVLIKVVDSRPPKIKNMPSQIVANATSPSGAVVTFGFTATDNVDDDVPVLCTPESGTLFPLGVTQVTCTATDSAGNTESASLDINVIVVDTILPTINIPADLTAEATSPSGAVVTFDVSATDNFDTEVAATCMPGSGSNFEMGVTDVMCTATDSSGNGASASFSVSVVDTTLPTINIPADLTAEATSPSGAAVTYSVSASDNIDGEIGVTCMPGSGTVFAFGVTPVMCTATDSSGNGASASFSVSVVDTTAPTINAPSQIVVEATSILGGAVTFDVSATDNFDTEVLVTCTPESGTVFAFGVTPVMCTATDSSGNGASASFDVDVGDTTLPTINIPADLTAEATSPSGAAVMFDVSATDNIGELPVTCTPGSGSNFEMGVTDVMCTATDSSGNSASASFSVSVVDTTAPTINAPSDLTAEATSPSGAAVTYSVSASDNIDGEIGVTCMPGSGTVFAFGVTPVMCTATDSSGNGASASFDVDVDDTTLPTINAPSQIVVEATSPSGAAVTFDVSATDNFDTIVVATCTPESGTLFTLGTTAVMCTATDSSGNGASASFDIGVVVNDTIAPTIIVPSDLTAEAASPSGAAVTYSVSASDNFWTEIVATCTPESGTLFTLGTTAVMCTATDSSGNGASASFSVSVVDTTLPTINIPADLTAEATSPSGAAVMFDVSATDNFDTEVAVTCTLESGTVFAFGVSEVMCTATDSSGNGASASFSVSVVDTTLPTINAPSQIVVEATSPSGAVVTFDVSATDNIDGEIPVTCTSESGVELLLGVTQVTCTATDSSGNGASASFDIEVGDTTLPTINVPSDITAEASSPAGAVVIFSVSASDNIGELPVICTPESGGEFPLGITAVTCTATDTAGNSNSASFNVSVVDTILPTINIPSDITVPAGSPGAVVTFSVSASDNIDGELSVTCTPESGTLFPLGTTTVTCTATDSSGNTASVSFNVTVVDVTLPTITYEITPTPNSNGWYNSDVIVRFTCEDTGSGPAEPYFDVTITLEGTGQSVSGTCNDNAGNSNSATVSGINIDKTFPTVTVMSTPEPNSNGWNNADVKVHFTATDASGIQGDSSFDAAFTLEGAGQTTSRAFVDLAGNSASASIMVNIDKTAPEAYNQFDPVTKKVLLFGRDALSGVPTGPINPLSTVQTRWFDGKAEIRTYEVVDFAGNSLKLVEKVNTDYREIDLKILSLQYNNGKVITPSKNKMEIDWKNNHDGSLKVLEQEIEIGKGKQEIEATFYSSENRTIIEIENTRPHTKMVNPSLVLLLMVTDKGQLDIEFYR